MIRLLIIEDDADIALSLRYSMSRDGAFAVRVAATGDEGLREALHDPPDVVLLDLSLPDIDGTEVCRRLREDPRTKEIPILMLTARVQESDVLDGLGSGADDYLTKPFSIRELVARVHAVLRRSERSTSRPRVWTEGTLVVDEETRRVTVDGRETRLTRREFELLVHLIRGAGRVATREQLLESVWGYENPGQTRTVDVHVRQLRRKLGFAADGPIETVVGVGYRIRSER